MDLQEAIYRGITGGRSSAAGSLGSAIREVAGRFGTRPPEGISPRTWRDMRSHPDRQRSVRISGALRTAQRAARVSPTRVRLLRGTPIIGIGGTVTVSSDTRERKIIVSRWTSPGSSLRAGDQTGLMSRVLDAWLAGDDRRAAQVFESGLREGLAGQADVSLTDVSPVRVWPATASGQRQVLMWQRT